MKGFLVNKVPSGIKPLLRWETRLKRPLLEQRDLAGVSYERLNGK